MMPMKTIKMSDQLHAELTVVVGDLTVESGQIKTYQDAIEALFCRSFILTPQVLREVEEFIQNNKQWGYHTKEEFFREAARWLINRLKREKSDPEIPRQNPANPSQIRIPLEA